MCGRDVGTECCAVLCEAQVQADVSGKTGVLTIGA